ncbi:hypothetical protein [Lentiprolixibacter aurantiacus]|uniref:DUF4258 domain-containing protein n=1 Tax=Lentiprolixibacter aurantiacus TaxID=2993939 RepID=A0AAE3MJG9_9FLAO|nr:hypothetical protein [Lentiprolixibacter aurantiacus]MCX2718915.1 hypothetical protein [Lentiprolixibacter aurantiacus]
MRITNHFKKRLKERFNLTVEELMNDLKNKKISGVFKIYKYGDPEIIDEYPHLYYKLREEGDKLIVSEPLNMVIVWKDFSLCSCYPIIG